MSRIIFIVFLFASFQLDAQVFFKVVAQDGSGTTKTLSIALQRVPDNSDTAVLIYVKNGIYNEKLELISSKKNVHLIGESVDGVIITYGDYNGDGTHGTADSYTFWADADDFYAENITFRNSAGNVGQAVAIRTDGERQVFKNCRFIGFQDTYYAHSNRQYNLNCTIEGATDFIFGDATCVFDNCTINCVKGGQYITAPSDSKLTSVQENGKTMIHGLLFNECLVTANSDVPANSYYLGRPWQPNASSVYTNCILGPHIRTEGWSIWNDDNHLSSYFAEYKSIDENGTAIDTTSRADWSYQIPDSIYTKYYNLDYFLRKEGVEWDPIPATVSLPTPENLTGTSYNLEWSSVSEAKGYVILRNDSTIGFSTISIYNDTTANSSILNTYKVKSVSENGNLSAPSNEYSVQASSVKEIGQAEDGIIIDLINKTVISVEPVNISVYSTAGVLIQTENKIMQTSLLNLKYGIYILRIENNSGQVITKKIIL